MKTKKNRKSKSRKLEKAGNWKMQEIGKKQEVRNE